MSNETYTPIKPGLAAKLNDWTAGARETAVSAAKETLTWSAYQWTVLALLTATFVLVALSYSGIRTELAALKQQTSAAAEESAPDVRSALDQQISDLKTTLTQSIAEVKSDLEASLAKLGAKIDAKSQQPKPAAAPAAKPPAKPRPQ
jgi:hypothetical protein